MANVYQLVTDRITAALAAGTVPWRKPWAVTGTATGARFPINAVTQRPYRGVNVLLLAMAGYQDNRWMTYRQAQELGGNVRKGEKSTLIVFWQDPKPQDLDHEPEQPSQSDEAAATTPARRPLLRYFLVFNASQVDGLSLEEAAPAEPQPEPIPAAEAIIAGMPQAPRIAYDGGAQAFYRPGSDSIHLPARSAFGTPEERYSTLFHELGHSTGHPSRLGRKTLTEPAPFGSPVYSQEELVAEFTAAFLCAHSGIENTVDNSAAYIAGWLRALQNDPRLVVIAAGQGQKAADYIKGTAPAAPLPSWEEPAVLTAA